MYKERGRFSSQINLVIKMSDKILCYDNVGMYLNRVKDKILPVQTSPLHEMISQPHAPTALSSEAAAYPLNT
jgi:hypothetical protein